jgi:hypothetical protein
MAVPNGARRVLCTFLYRFERVLAVGRFVRRIALASSVDHGHFCLSWLRSSLRG